VAGAAGGRREPQQHTAAHIEGPYPNRSPI
jgi:hypothetical protein